MATVKYTGARYVTKFSDPINWQANTAYEQIVAVQYQGKSYISKMPVPAGIGNPADNPNYWLLWAEPNAQFEELRQIVEGYDDRLDGFSDRLDDVEADLTTLEGRGTVVIIGDSYSYPQLPIYETENVKAWPTLLAEKTNYTIKNYARAGAGFVHATGTPFPQQAQQAASDSSYNHDDVTRVIVIGGINDTSSQENVQTCFDNANNTFRTLRNSFKNASIDWYPTHWPHVFDLAIQDYNDRMMWAASQNGVATHYEMLWALMNFRVQDAYCSDQIHPQQLGMNIILGIIMNGGATRLNGARTAIGASAFGALALTSASVGTLTQTISKTWERFSYDNGALFTEVQFQAKVNNLPTNNAPVIFDLPIDNANYLYYSANNIMPLSARATISNGYMAVSDAMVWGSHLYVFVTPLSNWRDDLELTFNVYVSGYNKLS